jgi:ATP-dependent DNA helicase RecQ
VLRNEEYVELARPRVKEKARKKPSLAATQLGTQDLRLFESLRELRKKLAAERSVPPYVIFGDATLMEMSQIRPETESEFLGINGVGQVKLDRHGSAFLDVIASYGPEFESIESK